MRTSGTLLACHIICHLLISRPSKLLFRDMPSKKKKKSTPMYICNFVEGDLALIGFLVTMFDLGATFFAGNHIKLRLG